MDNLTCANTAFMNDIQSFHQGITTYNKLYSIYNNQNCKSSTSDIEFTITGLDISDFSGNNIPNYFQFTETCPTLNRKLLNYGANLDYSRQNVQRSINLDGRKYLNSANKLNTEYTKVISKRNLLDTQMEEILGYQNSMKNEKQGILDSAVYTTLLWTVLTTSVLYYAFTKL